MYQGMVGPEAEGGRKKKRTHISFSSPEGSFTITGRCKLPLCALVGTDSLGAGEEWNWAARARGRRRAGWGRGRRRRSAALAVVAAEWRRRRAAKEGIGAMVSGGECVTAGVAE